MNLTVPMEFLEGCNFNEVHRLCRVSFANEILERFTNEIARLLEAPLVNFRAKVDHCNLLYVLATASAATLFGSGSSRFRQGSRDIEARKLHLR